MSDQARRKELRAQYKQTHPEAGVYRIVNDRNSRMLLGSSPNLASVRSKLEFSRTLNSSDVLTRRSTDGVPQAAALLRGRGGSVAADQQFNEDMASFGVAAFSMEVLELLEIEPEMTPEQIKDDLAALEELWRERLDQALLY